MHRQSQPRITGANHHRLCQHADTAKAAQSLCHHPHELFQSTYWSRLLCGESSPLLPDSPRSAPADIVVLATHSVATCAQRSARLVIPSLATCCRPRVRSSSHGSLQHKAARAAGGRGAHWHHARQQAAGVGRRPSKFEPFCEAHIGTHQVVTGQLGALVKRGNEDAMSP
jgi:hypothetical protein